MSLRSVTQPPGRPGVPRRRPAGCHHHRARHGRSCFASHPDAALLALEPHIVALAAEVDALCSVRSKIEEACYAASGPAPDAPVFARSDGSYERGLALFNDAMTAWRARHAEAAERLGLEDAEDAHGEADGRLLAACRELAAIAGDHPGGPDAQGSHGGARWRHERRHRAEHP